MTLILASGSPRRRALLALLVDDFTVQSPEVDETFPPGHIPTAMEAVALRKAQAVMCTEDDVILAADSVVLHEDTILGKPSGAEDAVRMLHALNGTAQQVVTAGAVVGPHGSVTFHAVTRVRLNLPPDALTAYVESGAWAGKAGGYGLQDSQIAPHATIHGPWSNVVGLPLEATRNALTRQGISCRPAPDELALSRQNPF